MLALYEKVSDMFNKQMYLVKNNRKRVSTL